MSRIVDTHKKETIVNKIDNCFVAFCITELKRKRTCNLILSLNVVQEIIFIKKKTSAFQICLI